MIKKIVLLKIWAKYFDKKFDENDSEKCVTVITRFQSRPTCHRKTLTSLPVRASRSSRTFQKSQQAIFELSRI